ncbi:Uncharacterised protein [Mycobacteroides abscessus subsp. abscessus]|nr:Uncharacterised protein [Mycobacteroides abscessus subsp. abscessus]SKH35282.1 Uncharacterised protein [Mycobacteroides abscessus subsp. abscessus]SKS88046.1 Uncharacterised protein [Mycobacteroides abscessus subsp. abscessus]
MGLLAADSGPDRRHEHLGGRQERQVAAQLTVDHRRIRTELIEHRQEGLDHPVDREERVGQRDTAHHRAEHIAFIPLRPSKFRRHRAVAAQNHLQAVDAFTAAGVHLVRHRRTAHLSWRKALGDQLVSGHQADGVRQRRRTGAELHQRRHHIVVQRARVYLAHARQGRGKAEEARNTLLQLGQLDHVSVEQVQHVLPGAHRPLDPPQRIPVEKLPQPGQREQSLVGGRCEPLTQRGCLRGDIVAAPGHHHVPVLDGVTREPRHHRDAMGMHVLQRAANLQLLHVLGEIAARHALMDVLVSGERVELLDTGLHIVAGDALTCRDRVKVHVLDHTLVVLDDTVGNLDAQIALCTQHRDPQLALQHHL